MLDEHEITSRYYRERALPHLLPFPSRRALRAVEPLAEGFAKWDATSPMEDLDLVGTVLRSPTMIPGVTPVQRVFGVNAHRKTRKAEPAGVKAAG